MINKVFYKKKSVICKTSKIYPFSRITNSKIDSYSYVSYFSQINNTTIGKYCSIAKRVSVGLGFHPINFISTSPIFYSPQNPVLNSFVKEIKFNDFKNVKIGNDVWIGANVVIIDGVTIGDGAIIGANSVISKDIDPYSIVGGVPAKHIKYRFSSEIIKKLLKIKWWNLPHKFLRKKSILEIFAKEINLEIIKSLEKKINEFKNQTA
tara:strand:- start:6206 stop:6826 length:621 start_codon:yes stop_codon:yes gene_type:complete